MLFYRNVVLDRKRDREPWQRVALARLDVKVLHKTRFGLCILTALSPWPASGLLCRRTVPMFVQLVVINWNLVAAFCSKMVFWIWWPLMRYDVYAFDWVQVNRVLYSYFFVFISFGVNNNMYLSFWQTLKDMMTDWQIDVLMDFERQYEICSMFTYLNCRASLCNYLISYIG